VFDGRVVMDGSAIEPMVTWGVTPGQSVGVLSCMPMIEALDPEDRDLADLAFKHMKFQQGQAVLGQKIDVGFVGSCTNSRISDLREAASVLQGQRVHESVKLLVVPGSQQVKQQAESEGLDLVFQAAGAEWREPGCSMCLAMNPDRLQGDQVCASSSNRNFIGRQGSPSGRTLLMSPAMVAAAAVAGEVMDIRQWRRQS
jgi:3-isopropylmalate/(R)-2-methylmalate dehydratase large subunit